MMKKSRKQSVTFNIPTLTLEGGLFLPDQLEKAARGDADFQAESDYQTPKGLRVKDDYSRAFQIACAQWQQFSEQFERTDINADQLTKDFVFELLKDVFAYTQITQIKGIQASERHYPAQLCAGQVPIIVAPFNLGLDESHDGFAVANTQWQDKSRKKSAFQMAQELLNASDEHLWALVTNGKQIRLLRDAASLTRPSFLEIDLQDILQGKRFSEFANVWRLIHASRFNQATNPEQSIWEKWRDSGKQEGSRVRDGLRIGVETALLVLGQGFVQHPANQPLRDDLLSGELTKGDYFQELLRLVYRFIFLFNVEERGILHAEDNSKAGVQARQAYALGYALVRLRNTCLKRRARNQFNDQWQAIKVVFKGLENGQPLLALPALGGLFAGHQCQHLDQSSIDNTHLLTAMENLRWANLNGTKMLIDYRNMDTEELGSVYESLLELLPEIDIHARKFGFVGITSEGSTAGNARKISGSYYTPDSLVQELIKSALEPVIEDRIKQNSENPIEALLAIRVIDPACGSGHFLLAAARKLAERLAQLRAPESAVKPKDYRQALHDVIRNCIFGVDRNPMALELARTALWIEGFAEDEPLSFLDHHLQCGDALLGLMDLKALERGIPKDAFKALSGDDNRVCKELAKQNAAELKDLEKKRTAKVFKQVDEFISKDNGLDALKAIEAMPDRTTKQIAAKEQAYQQFLTQATESPLRHAADMLLGAFLIKKTAQNQQQVPTTASVILELMGENSLNHREKKKLAAELCKYNYVLHWPLVFPQVFAQGGFDCILGNPPWKRVQFDERNFFFGKDFEIFNEENKSKRLEKIQGLKVTSQELWIEWQTAYRKIETFYNYLKGSNSLPLTAIDKFNLYAVFTERSLQILSKNGKAGLILDAGIISDQLSSNLIEYCFRNRLISKVREFENSNLIFRDVHKQERFVLLTLGACSSPVDCALGLRNVNESAAQISRVFMTYDDLKLYSPEVFSLPKFSNSYEYEIFRKCYKKSPFFLSDKDDSNSWKVKISRYINVTDFSGEIKKRAEINDEELELYLPLMEGKLFNLYDFKYATYSMNENVIEFDTKSKQNTQNFLRYIPKNIALRRNPRVLTSKYFLLIRDTTHSTNERGIIACIAPNYITDYTVRVVEGDLEAKNTLILLASLNSLVIDFIARMRIGGNHLSNYIINQLPILNLNQYSKIDTDFILNRSLQLTYISDELNAFANELDHESGFFSYDKSLRSRLQSELDAYYAKLYGFTRDELRYILNPADVMGEDCPSETFRVLKNSEIKEFGEYRTRRLVLEAWDKLEGDELV